VVLKGGHLGGETSDDLFHDGTGTVTLPARRIVTRNTHGTGCTLSAAIAALLARGLALRQAVEQAKAYVTTALQAADRLSVGTGHGPVHHFQAWW
jgi:hydroxymethylpyrimidine/phosphomethylpyrimidine kinase